MPRTIAHSFQVVAWRNPYSENESHTGTPTGIPSERDNARTLNLTAHIVANHRQGEWLCSDRFENRTDALSGTMAAPPLTQTESCDGLRMLLPLAEWYLAEMEADLDRSDRHAVRRYCEAIATAGR